MLCTGAAGRWDWEAETGKTAEAIGDPRVKYQQASHLSHAEPAVLQPSESLHYTLRLHAARVMKSSAFHERFALETQKHGF